MAGLESKTRPTLQVSYMAGLESKTRPTLQIEVPQAGSCFVDPASMNFHNNKREVVVLLGVLDPLPQLGRDALANLLRG